MKNLIPMMLAAALASGTLACAQESDVPSVVSVPGVSFQAGSAPKDDLFAGTEKFAQGASKVEEVNLDPSTMSIVGGDPKGKQKDRELASRMQGMFVREYTYDKPGMYSMQDVNVYIKKLDDGTWSCSVRVRSNTENSAICSRPVAGSNGGETVIIEAKPTKLTFVRMRGNFSLNDLNDKGKQPAPPPPPPAAH